MPVTSIRRYSLARQLNRWSNRRSASGYFTAYVQASVPSSWNTSYGLFPPVFETSPSDSTYTVILFDPHFSLNAARIWKIFS